MTRRVKQIVYSTFYLIVLICFVSAFYFVFIKPAPTCFDNVQNQNEEGIDCGGPCARFCLPHDLKPIDVVDRIYKFEPDSAHLSLLARISNPNLGYAAKNFSYSFLLYDDKGVLVQSFSGNSFIYAGEVKYIAVPNVAAPLTSFSRIDFKLENPKWVPALEFGSQPQIALRGTEARISNNNSLATEGQIVNNDTLLFPSVKIVVVFKGQLGQLTGVSETEINNLAPNESRPFSVVHPPITNVDISGTKIFAYALRP